jgi:hypothetical protein
LIPKEKYEVLLGRLSSYRMANNPASDLKKVSSKDIMNKISTNYLS